ncbi:MAG: pantoate--beta-alanine ligase [Candidatus Latescibacteria bacterium]|nr:pantoate--beta-alanine ligase [Candidatus Latescibacterota bacterium]
MQRFRRPARMLEWSRQQRCAGDVIAFVPTMGALHQGHLSLVDLAAERADRVVVSIFVNPAQFGPSEDFDLYPRDLEGDLKLLSEREVDAVLIPDTGDLYPAGFTTWVVEEELSDKLEGAARPGHFRGVTTVVTKLLLVVEPDIMILGQKDAQQVAVLKRIIHDLMFPVDVIVGPIIREPDSIALSSRNAYLSGEERKQAVCLHDSLRLARKLLLEGEVDSGVVMDAMRERIESEPSTRVDYIAAVHPDTFETLDTLSDTTLFCLAVFVGDTRLIDNELVELGN